MQSEYRLEYNAPKHRIYLRVAGYWGADFDARQFLDTVNQMLQSTKTGFTFLADYTQFEIPHSSLGEMLCTVEVMLREYGALQVAEVFPHRPYLFKYFETLAFRTKITRRAFTDIDLANAWLNEASAYIGPTMPQLRSRMN